MVSENLYRGPGLIGQGENGVGLSKQLNVTTVCSVLDPFPDFRPVVTLGSQSMRAE